MIPRYSRPEVAAIWSDQAKFQLWLDIEIAALEAMVNEGIVPKEALEGVRAKAAFDTERVLEIEKTVKHDVIAFLTNVAENVGEPARYLHYGMTSSDLGDTCFATQLTRATDLILTALESLLGTVKDQAYKYKDLPCVGRSHGIHAEPTTFGLKVANWYAELERAQKRIRAAREDIAVGAISGAVGTYAHLPPSIEAHVCKAMGLKPVSISTQVIARDNHAALFQSFALLAAALERICVEVRHLQRTEVREVEENFTRGQKGSSAMPHKRNPILSENITGLARTVRALASVSYENIALWHERDISHSSAERMIAPDITVTLDFMLGRVNNIVGNLKVYPENMEKNLNLTRGLIFSGCLLLEIASRGESREDAYEIVQKHALDTWDDINGVGDGSGKSFQERMQADSGVAALISKEELAKVFCVERYLKNVDTVFARVFES